MVEVTKPNRNRKKTQKNIKIAVKNANLCGKICHMRILLKYAKNAAISEICGNRIKLTCLVELPTIELNRCLLCFVLFLKMFKF